ncbi:MAG: ribokinase [Bacteroidales bacterium]|jgi:ribokinase|nr:ribokinase [Bacteroidales bacterium]MCI2121644.1 ribokinase [Bacteroidales bacterium]MCI2144958.1 ribokinase [Bacteroidales bacterium]
MRKIAVVGSCNTDMIVKSKHLPAAGETILGGDFLMSAGGKGANQAVAISRLGGNVTFICKIGDDVFGEKAMHLYAEEGIDTSNILTSSSHHSGVALISVDDNAENSIVVSPGANYDLLPEDVEKNKALIASADILLMQLEIPIETVMRAAEIAYENGVKIVLNPAPACEVPESLLKKLFLFIPNANEASFYSGVACKDNDSVKNAAGIIHSKGVKNVIITIGDKGSLLCEDGGFKYFEAIKVHAVDTTAAGDTYCGAICQALSEGRSLDKSISFATYASALAVQKIGAQPSIPTRKELDNYMRVKHLI